MKELVPAESANDRLALYHFGAFRAFDVFGIEKPPVRRSSAVQAR
jgi:hypothetical protein